MQWYWFRFDKGRMPGRRSSTVGSRRVRFGSRARTRKRRCTILAAMPTEATFLSALFKRLASAIKRRQGHKVSEVESLSQEGPIRIPPLFPFPSAPFPRNEKEDGTLELYYLSAYCLPKILLLQLVGHRVIQISHVFRGFPMLQLPYQFGRSGMDRLNIPLGSLVLTFLCGIHSRSALGITSSSGGNSSQNPSTSPTSLPQPFLVPLLKQNGFMFFHRLVIPFRSYLFLQFRSRLVHKIEWPILLRTLDSIVFQEC
ncbi:unnamed protein product [Lactuca saligna]|uniref:Uncharacterized protein n=1 Tax=Lactuca saligna TaxID=75948 RepID=A0AA35YWV2_LACSI|nr:unnamed protein product [Lactuca saligna]